MSRYTHNNLCKTKECNEYKCWHTQDDLNKQFIPATSQVSSCEVPILTWTEILSPLCATRHLTLVTATDWTKCLINFWQEIMNLVPCAAIYHGKGPQSYSVTMVTTHKLAQRNRTFSKRFQSWPFWLPVVWSEVGPVPIDGELPDCLSQLKSSSLELFQLQKSFSNVQSHLDGGCVVGGAGVVGKGVGLEGPWKHQGTFATELSQQHPRAWHCVDVIPT